jgi:hypothetical protein
MRSAFGDERASGCGELCGYIFSIWSNPSIVMYWQFRFHFNNNVDSLLL